MPKGGSMGFFAKYCVLPTAMLFIRSMTLGVWSSVLASWMFGHVLPTECDYNLVYGSLIASACIELIIAASIVLSVLSHWIIPKLDGTTNEWGFALPQTFKIIYNGLYMHVLAPLATTILMVIFAVATWSTLCGTGMSMLYYFMIANFVSYGLCAAASVIQVILYFTNGSKKSASHEYKKVKEEKPDE